MPVSVSARFTTKDLDRLPDIPGIRYEIIDGVLYVAKAPGWEHQYSLGQVFHVLKGWSDRTGLGLPLMTPGLVFAEDDNAIPDILWISLERLTAVVDDAGHLTAAPELVVEVVSPGRENERRDREVKLDLYARRGVAEYWIVDWLRRSVDVYRRAAGGLRLDATLAGDDALTTPLLPGFSCPVITLWPPRLDRRSD
jgi:Uma2 family endonuclease